MPQFKKRNTPEMSTERSTNQNEFATDALQFEFESNAARQAAMKSGYGKTPASVGADLSGYGKTPASVGPDVSGYGKTPASVGPDMSGYGKTPASVGADMSGYAKTPAQMPTPSPQVVSRYGSMRSAAGTDTRNGYGKAIKIAENDPRRSPYGKAFPIHCADTASMRHGYGVPIPVQAAAMSEAFPASDAPGRRA